MSGQSGPVRALEDRKVIERAEGNVMRRRRRVSEDEAYRRLRKLASDRNLKLVAVGQTVLKVEEMFQALEEGEPRAADRPAPPAPGHRAGPGPGARRRTEEAGRARRAGVVRQQDRPRPPRPGARAAPQAGPLRQPSRPRRGGRR
jgi:hypothetical protein